LKFGNHDSQADLKVGLYDQLLNVGLYDQRLFWPTMMTSDVHRGGPGVQADLQLGLAGPPPPAFSLRPL